MDVKEDELPRANNETSRRRHGSKPKRYSLSPIFSSSFICLDYPGV